MTIWFTSDTHFYHKKVIEYCQRPVADVEEMNEWLIERWNERIRPDDEVYHLGDFFFCGVSKAAPILERLNGEKNWILGNHDYKLWKKLDCPMFFKSVKHYKKLKIDGQRIILCHFPILSWDRLSHGSWHLHGHCHGSLNGGPHDHGKRLDVGVDCHNWYPISFEDVRDFMKGREIVKVDHH